MDRYFLKSFFLYGGATGLSRILPILMLPIYLANIGLATYGTIEIIFAGFNLLMIFGLFQLETALQRLYFKAESKSELFYSTLIFVAVASLLIVVLVVLFSENISYLLFDTGNERNSIILASICVFFANIATICMVVLRYMDKAVSFCFLTIGHIALTAVVTYYFIVETQYGSFGYFLGQIFGWIFIACFSFYSVIKELKFKDGGGAVLRLSLGFSMPQVPARLASFFVLYGNRFFVLHLLGLQAVALLSLSLKFAVIFQFFALAFSMAWNPFIYKNEKKSGMANKINSIFIRVLIVLWMIHITVILSAEYVVKSFFDPQFSGVVDLIPLAIIPAQLLIIKEIVETGIKLSNRTKYISYAYFVSVFITILGFSISSTLEQILISSVIGTLMLVLMSWYYSEKLYNINYPKLPFLIYLVMIFFHTYMV